MPMFDGLAGILNGALAVPVGLVMNSCRTSSEASNEHPGAPGKPTGRLPPLNVVSDRPETQTAMVLGNASARVTL